MPQASLIMWLCALLLVFGTINNKKAIETDKNVTIVEKTSYGRNNH